jgi:uncharacterized protein (TIGR03083 family)
MSDVDVGVVYAAGRERVVELVGGLTAEAASTPVPACPEWRVHDLLAHVAGVCSDVLAGRLDGAGTDPWTEAQVAARRDRDLGEIVAEWNETAPQVEAIAKDFGPAGKQWVFDFASHEQDLRGALAAPGARSSDAWWIELEFITPAFHAGAAARDLAPVRIVTGDREWVAAGTAPVETLTVDPFELGRALTGRRSADQIRAFGWSTDPEPYLGAFEFGPFTLRPTALRE